MNFRLRVPELSVLPDMMYDRMAASRLLVQSQRYLVCGMQSWQVVGMRKQKIGSSFWETIDVRRRQLRLY